MILRREREFQEKSRNPEILAKFTTRICTNLSGAFMLTYLPLLSTILLRNRDGDTLERFGRDKRGLSRLEIFFLGGEGGGGKVGLS